MTDNTDDTEVIPTSEAFARATKYLAEAWGGPVIVVGLTETLSGENLTEIRFETCIKGASSPDVFAMLTAFLHQVRARFEDEAQRCGCDTCCDRLVRTGASIDALGVELLEDLPVEGHVIQ